MQAKEQYTTNAEKIASWKWRRVKAKMTQADMAAIVGVTVPQLSTYESGAVEPKSSTIDKIEKALLDKGV